MRRRVAGPGAAVAAAPLDVRRVALVLHRDERDEAEHGVQHHQREQQPVDAWWEPARTHRTAPHRRSGRVRTIWPRARSVAARYCGAPRRRSSPSPIENRRNILISDIYALWTPFGTRCRPPCPRASPPRFQTAEARFPSPLFHRPPPHVQLLGATPHTPLTPGPSPGGRRVCAAGRRGPRRPPLARIAQIRVGRLCRRRPCARRHLPLRRRRGWHPRRVRGRARPSRPRSPPPCTPLSPHPRPAAA